MDKLFDTVLELSWQAGLIALAVMAVRLVLRKKASRRALCMLWALVALRLLLPVSLTVESPVSLQAEEAPVSRAYHAMQETRTSVPEEAAPAPAESSGAAAAVVPTEPAAEPVTLRTFARWLPWIWVIGMGCMAAYMLLSFIWMRLTLRRAEHIQDNVYRCTQWSTPFVLGIIAPRIYVPESVSEEDLPQVLAHERCHIRRWDHVAKPFAFLLLAVKERVKNVLGYKKPAIWAAVILAAAAVVIGVCLLTKPSYKNVGTLDAEKLFALRTPYVDNNSAVGAILDALGFRELGSSGADYGYAVHLSTDREPMGITVLYTYEGAVPQRSEERYRQIAMRGYIALALIDNAEWFSWQEHGADGTSNKADRTAGDSLYPIVYPGYPDTARESAEGLQAYINMLQQWMKDDAVPYVYGESEQRDGWGWNADRLDEYRWKWELSAAALYDDVMRLGMQTRASMAGYDCRSQITTEEDSTGVDVFLYPMRGGRDGGGDRRRAGDVDAGRAAHDAGAERQGAVGAVFHGGRGQRGALLGPGFRGRLGIRHRRGAGEQRGAGKAHQGAEGRHRARSGGRELRHDGGRRGGAVRSTGFAAGNQRGEHQVAGDAVQRPPQREGRGL